MAIYAEGYAYNERDRDWTTRVEYVARDRMEAIRWINFQKDWMKRLKIISGPQEICKRCAAKYPA
jgi:hypothetical protein